MLTPSQLAAWSNVVRVLIRYNEVCSIDGATSFVSVAYFLQAKALLKFIEAISEQTLRSTVAMTAARGRGKSAALGLAISAAVAFGLVFNNIMSALI